jgi:hypothetical protein
MPTPGWFSPTIFHVPLNENIDRIQPRGNVLMDNDWL